MQTIHPTHFESVTFGVRTMHVSGQRIHISPFEETGNEKNVNAVFKSILRFGRKIELCCFLALYFSSFDRNPGPFVLRVWTALDDE